MPNRRKVKRLQMQTGNELRQNVQVIAGESIRFVTPDGRTMFSIEAREDGRSISIRAVDTCKVGGKLYRTALAIEPVVGNVVCIRTLEYNR